MTKIWKSVCLTVILALVLSLGMVVLPASEVQAVEQTYESYANTTDGDTDYLCWGSTWQAQTFTASSDHNITGAWMYMVRDDTFTGTVTVSIRNTDGSGQPIGSDLTAVSFSETAVPTSLGWVTATFSTPIWITNGVKYALVVRSVRTSGVGQIWWRADATSPTYTDGNMETSSDSGSTWSSTTNDLLFQIRGDPALTLTPVFIDPTPKDVVPLETFTVNVDIIPGEPTRGAQFDMSFDQSLLTCTGVTEGDLYNVNDTGGANPTTWQLPAIDNGAGTITGAACAVSGGVPVSHPGTFAIISFTAKDVPGTSELDLSNVVVGDASAGALLIQVTDGQVIIHAGSVADFTWTYTDTIWNDTLDAGEEIQFTDNSTNDPTSWSWDFDDGDSSTAQNPTHTYSRAGTYSVDLTATNLGGSDTASDDIEVLPAFDAGLAASWDVLYGADGAGGNPDTNLYILDPDTGEVEETIGPIGYAVTGLSFAPDGTLYGTTGQKSPNAPSSLIEIDTETGEGTLIGDINIGDQSAADISFGRDGVLYGWIEAGDDDLATINLNTGEATIVGNAALGTWGSGLGFTPDGTLWFTGDGDGGWLRTINPSTGAYTNKFIMDSPYEEGYSIGALASDANGTLYGARKLSWDDPPKPCDLIIIDTTTGEITSVGSTVDDLDAIAFGPAPPEEEEVVVEEVVEEEVAAGPSRFSHRYLNVSPVQTYSNQPVTISMVVANTGESRGSVQINLTINGTIEQSQRITIDSGSSKRLEFTVMKLDPGTYDFYVGRLQGQFHVIATAAFVPPPPPPGPPTAIPDTTGQLGTGGIIAIVIIGIMVIGGLVVAFMMTRRA